MEQLVRKAMLEQQVRQVFKAKLEQLVRQVFRAT
jgi:hypothetical protein